LHEWFADDFRAAFDHEHLMFEAPHITLLDDIDAEISD